MPIDLIASTDYGWIRSVLFLPYAVAHHRYRRRTLLIVLVGEQPADPGLHAKGPEEISGNVLSIARIRLRLRALSADAKRCIAGLQRCQVPELRRARAKMLVRFPREQRKIAIVALRVPAPVAAANLVSDPPQLVRLGHRQRLQHYLVHQREDRSCRSDPECQCDQSGCCKS